ncbi:MAG: polysaccharide biosynthesis protein [Desulfobacteraceae bacterium]|nr:polysaccharide biosynthesis protein [Desulfobacteraceae bacterium]
MKIRLSFNLFIVLFADLMLLFCSLYFAYLFRFDFVIPNWIWKNFVKILPYIVLVKILCLAFFDLYKGMWRYTSLSDLVNVVKAATAGAVFGIVFVLYTNRFEGIPRSVFIIDWCLTLIFIGGLRLAVRLYFEQFREKNNFKNIISTIFSIFRKNKMHRSGVLIIGAGNCGVQISREIRDNPSVQYQVSGFLDDDPAKIGRKIHGISVLDKIDEIRFYAEATEADEVIIAIPSATATMMRRVVSLCKDAGVKFKIVPSMGELINGKVSVSSIRPVEYRDLLGREEVKLDKEQIGKYLGTKTVLVTGAGGSIGRGLCKQICRYSPEKIILVERAESPLYEIDLELQKEFPGIGIVPVLSDVQHKWEVEIIFEFYSPEIVFHAAAYKHVPMLEAHPWKAVENNIVGTENLVEVAGRSGCDKFVFVSTDKAVNPTNIMGTSKRIAELIVQNRYPDGASSTKFMTVRFGNVIGSVGSVIPLFKKQIKEGGPVTVTHPEIIRYFMLIPEACQLILQAGAMGNGGEIYVLEMGKPIKISDMAKDLIRFSGFEPGLDIKIEYIGLRAGEKLYEELMTEDENVIPTGHDKIMVLSGIKQDINTISKDIEDLKGITKKRNKALIVEQLKKMVPEFTPLLDN